MAFIILGALGGLAVGGLGGWALGGLAGAAIGGVAGAAFGGMVGAAMYPYPWYYSHYWPSCNQPYYYQPYYPVMFPRVYPQYPMQWGPAPAFGYW
jgi:hypothetical protein